MGICCIAFWIYSSQIGSIFLSLKSRAYKAAAMGICCIAIEELRKELISLLSGLDQRTGGTHYSYGEGLAS